jgi:Domain of unknown function (DUF4352)
MYCAKHPNVETVVSCGRCGTPVCPKCMVHAEVGVRCRQCSPPSRMSFPNRGSWMLGGALVLGAIITLGVVFGGGTSSPGFDEGYYDDYLEDFAGKVSVENVEDPWEPPASSTPPPAGRRYIAVEVTVENENGGNFPVVVTSSQFKLTDSENFVYQPVYGQIEPGLPEGIQLAKGEKARGWIVFEVEEDSEIQSLSYYTTEIDLPAQVSR